MQKDRSYHEAAIQYNEEIENFANELATRLQHEEVARWARSVAKQHHFHAGRHKKALAKFDSQDVDTVNTEDGGEDRVFDDEKVVHRSAASGQFVTQEFADDHPRTTVEETVDAPELTETEKEADRNAAMQPDIAKTDSEAAEILALQRDGADTLPTSENPEPGA